MRIIFPENTLDISPQDAIKAGISTGDKVVVTSNGFEKIWTAKIDEKQSPGILHIALQPMESLGPNPHPVSIRKSDV